MSRTAVVRVLYALVLLSVAEVIVVRNDRQAAEVYGKDWVGGLPHRWPAEHRWMAARALRLESDCGAALVVLTIGLGLAALRSPFVPPGRRWPGRGRAAIAAATLGLCYGILNVVSEVVADPASQWTGWANPRFLLQSLQSCRGSAPDAVLGAWALLALAGRWRSKEAGLGRLSRRLGWAWLALLAFDLVRATF